eukprot:gene5924-8026_t
MTPEFHRIRRLPPYVLEEVNRIKARLRADGVDIIDFGMGNPDMPTPKHIVDKLIETARDPKAGRYSASKGIVGLRRAMASYYDRRFGVKLNPDTEVIATLGSKEGFANLAQALTAPGDEFARERPLPQGPDAPPPILVGMTGGEDLLETGRWESVPEYGQVWYPPVAVGWVPYRHGRWSFVAPWGWTWIDEAPWGFAPFHYGRWRQFGPRWGWMPSVPGVRQYARPIYSPALVAFVGVGAGLAINRPVGWVPLGPREAYHPPYRASPAYVRNLNVMHAPNFSGGPPHGPEGFINRRGATAMPAGAMGTIESHRLSPRIAAVSP